MKHDNKRKFPIYNDTILAVSNIYLTWLIGNVMQNGNINKEF